MKIWSLVVLALAAAGLAAFLLTRGSPTDPSGLEPGGVEGHGSTGSTTSGAADLPPGDVPEGAESVELPEVSDPPAEGAGSSPDSAADVDPKVFLAQRDWELRQVALAEQYGGIGATELRDLLARVEGDISEQRKVLFGDRFDRGIYAIQVLGAFPLNPPDPGPRGRLPLQETRTQTDIETGRIEAHVATLPIEEYPDFYDLLDERDWLKGRIGE